MRETVAAKARAEAKLRMARERDRQTPGRDDVARIVHAHRDLGGVLSQANAEEKARLYRELGLALTYDVSTHEILVEMRLDQDRGLAVGVRRATATNTPRIRPLTTVLDLPTGG
jgi:hypothetical protein